MNGSSFIILLILVVISFGANDRNTKQKNQFYRQITVYTQQARQGDMDAMRILAEKYATGEYTLFDNHFGKNLTYSAYWYEQLADKGNTDAQLKIAQIYRYGTGVAVDLEKAVYWYEQLTKKGNLDAHFEIAKIYEQGFDGKPNLEQANVWYYQAYLKGHHEAGFILANNLLYGKGVDRNEQQAINIYQNLAEKHYEPAIYMIGYIYDDGLFGIQENNQIALQYFNKIPNYTGVSGVNGKIYKIELEISVDNSNSTKANQLVEQIPQKQSSSNTNKTYSSVYYGRDSKCTAICWDGTCSKSLGRRGVCSHHGGVKHWLR